MSIIFGEFVETDLKMSKNCCQATPYAKTKDEQVSIIMPLFPSFCRDGSYITAASYFHPRTAVGHPCAG